MLIEIKPYPCNVRIFAMNLNSLHKKSGLWVIWNHDNTHSRTHTFYGKTFVRFGIWICANIRFVAQHFGCQNLGSCSISFTVWIFCIWLKRFVLVSCYNIKTDYCDLGQKYLEIRFSQTVKAAKEKTNHTPCVFLSLYLQRVSMHGTENVFVSCALELKISTLTMAKHTCTAPAANTCTSN